MRWRRCTSAAWLCTFGPVCGPCLGVCTRARRFFWPWSSVKLLETQQLIKYLGLHLIPDFMGRLRLAQGLLAAAWEGRKTHQHPSLRPPTPKKVDPTVAEGPNQSGSPWIKKYGKWWCFWAFDHHSCFFSYIINIIYIIRLCKTVPLIAAAHLPNVQWSVLDQVSDVMNWVKYHHRQVLLPFITCWLVQRW